MGLLANVHIAAFFNVLSALGIVAVTAILAMITRRYVRVTEKTLDAIQAQADWSARLAREAIRSRVDQRAPQMDILREPSTKAFVRGDGDVWTELRRDARFHRPVDDALPVAVLVDLVIENSGAGTGRVRIVSLDGGPGQLHVDESRIPGVHVDDSGPRVFPALPRHSEKLLAAGKHVTLRLYLECSLQQWIEMSPVVGAVVLQLEDEFEEGMRDTIEISIVGRPLLTNPADGSIVVNTHNYAGLAQGHIAECRIGPTIRRYRGENM
ncbi:MAG: hypothetical protein ACRDZ8_14505 [Acidimicrobiales bacterium]